MLVESVKGQLKSEGKDQSLKYIYIYIYLYINPQRQEALKTTCHVSSWTQKLPQAESAQHQITIEVIHFGMIIDPEEPTLASQDKLKVSPEGLPFVTRTRTSQNHH